MRTPNRLELLDHITRLDSRAIGAKKAIGLPDTDADTLVFNRSNRGRVAIFIDGSNLFYAALQLGIEIDYTKLLCYLTAGSRLLRAFSTPEWIAQMKSNKVFCSGCVAMATV